VFLVIIRLGEGLIDAYGAGRSGGPLADEEILYREGREEPVVPGSEACSLGHSGGGRRKVGMRRVDVDWALCNVIGGKRSSPCLPGTLNVPMAENKPWITHSAPSPLTLFVTTSPHNADSSDSARPTTRVPRIYDRTRASFSRMTKSPICPLIGVTNNVNN
jgi:hypothetical protein